MEFVDGCSLDVLLDRDPRPARCRRDRRGVGAVADALEFAHGNGVLHLDVKPGNVLVSRDGRIKVADFGMAALSSATGHGTAERRHARLHAARAARRASRRPSRPTSGRSPLLAYECLTGANPFSAPTVEAARTRLETLEPAAAQRLGPRASALRSTTSCSPASGPTPDDRYPDRRRVRRRAAAAPGRPCGRPRLARRAGRGALRDRPRDRRGPRLGARRALGPAPGAGSAVGLLRGLAAVESAWLTWAGLSPLGLEPLPLAAAAGAAAVAGGFAPALGTGSG